MSTTISPGNARQLVAAALNRFAEHYAAELEGWPERYDVESVARDVALARTLAGNVTGWTHTTRLREFLDAGRTLEALSSYSSELETATI